MLDRTFNILVNLKVDCCLLSIKSSTIDALALGYCKSFAVLQTVEKWLKDKYPLLKRNATDDSIAAIEKIAAQVKRIRASILIPQSLINQSADAFRDKFPNEDGKASKRDPKYEFKSGQCSGYSGVVGYGLFMQYFPKRFDSNQKEIPRDDWMYLERVFKRVVTIDYKKPIATQEKQEFERVFSLISGIQCGTHLGPPWQGDWHDLISDTQNRKLSPPYTLAPPVISLDVSYIFNLLLDKALAPKSEPRIFLLTSHNHDVVLVQYPEMPDEKHLTGKRSQWYFVDINNFTGVVPVSSVTDLQTLLYVAFDFKENKPSPLGVRVFSHKEAPNFPKQADILANLWIVKNSKLNNIDDTYCQGISGYDMAMFIGCIPSLTYFLTRCPDYKRKTFVARKAVVEFFIQKKMDLSGFDPYLMHQVVLGNDVPLIKVLAKHNPAYVNSRNLLLDTPLHLAVKEKLSDAADALLEAKPDLTVVNGHGDTAFQAALKGGSVGVMKAFHKQGVTELPDAKGRRPLHLAAIANNRQQVELLLDAGVTPYATAGDSGLRASLLTTDPALQQTLVQAMLLVAIRNEDSYLLKRQLRRLKDIKMPLRDGSSLAVFAARYSNILIMHLLIAVGLEVNAMGHRKERALHVAAERGDFRMVQLLLESGASLTATRADGKTARDLAKNHPDALEILNNAYTKKADEIQDKTFKRLG